MKITIKRGESVQNASQYLLEFLTQYEEQYPILKSDMNVYVTLTGFGSRICPENEKEYILSQNGVRDVEAERIAEAKEKLINEWNRYIKCVRKCAENVEKQLKSDMEYLETAVEKKRKPEMVERRRKAFEKKREDYKSLSAYCALLEELEEMRIKAAGVRWHFIKINQPKMTYVYTLKPYLIFVNTEGTAWHFQGFGGRYDVAPLKKGMPPELQDEEGI